MSDEGTLFLDINAENPEVNIIESLCVNCEKNGKTMILLTKIPFFKGKAILILAKKFDQILQLRLRPQSHIKLWSLRS